MATPAGWYTDPNDAAQQRYWDGSDWTEQRRPLAPPNKNRSELNKFVIGVALFLVVVAIINLAHR